MKNFLQVNRALVAEKKHLLFNQSFGTEGNPNQTGKTLTPSDERAMTERKPRGEKEQLSSTCLRSASVLPPFRYRYLRYAAMIFAMLTLACGNVWGQTKVTTSNFYKLYSTSKDDCSTLVTNASFPSYAGNTFNANMNGSLSSVPSISTPHNFAGLNTTDKYYRIKMASKKTLTLTNVANVKKVTFYGNGSSSTRTISVSVAKVSGSGSTFSVTPLSLANSNATIVAYATEDFTGKSGYDANTYYTYTFTADGDVSLWGVYVECGATTSYRTFKSGEKIYLKDAGGNFDFSAQWKTNGGDVYAYFWNSTENAWSSNGNLVDGSWNEANAVYEITVPGTGKEFTDVVFTRGSAATFESGFWHKSIDTKAPVGKNMFDMDNVTEHKVGAVYNGNWANFTPASKTVYFDNRNVGTWTTAYVRIGHGSNNSAWGPMTKVAGTKYLYSKTTSKWVDHTDFAIANKAGWTGSNHIDQPEKTYSNGSWSGSEHKMTMQTNYQQYAIDSDMYICPKATSVLEHECQYYQVTNANSTTTSRIDDKTIGLRLPSYTVTSTFSNCAIAMVKYTADDGSTTESLPSGGTVKPSQYVKATVTPSTGYKFSAVTLSGTENTDYTIETAAAAGTPGVYSILGNVTINAVCVAKQCTITFDKNGGSSGSNGTTGTYAQAMTTITPPTRDGYIFDGYWDSETSNDGSGNKYYNADGTSAAAWNKDTESATTLYAKWNCVTPTFGTNLSTSQVDYDKDASASALTVAATAGGGTVTYQWYSNDENNTTTPITLTNCTTATYTPLTSSVGTTYYYCVATNSTAGCSTTTTSNIAKIVVSAAATYSVTYHKNGDGAGGDGSVTGSVPSDATAYTSGQRPVVKGPGDLALSGKIFIGWNDEADGSGTYYSEKSNFSITADKDLYAQWRTASAWPASGTVFSLSMNNRTTTALAFNFGQSELLSNHATISGGNAAFTDIRTSNSPEGTKATITQASPAALKIEGNGVMIVLYLDDALQKDDEISFTCSDNRELCFTTTSTRATSIVTSGKSLTIGTGSALIGKKVIYVWRNSSTTPITALTITRPASNYTGLSVEKDPAAGSASAPTISATSVAQGSGVTVTAGAAAAGYVFTGWTSENGTFANASSLSTTFTPNANNAVATAHYTATKTIVIKIKNDENKDGWVIQGITTYPADQSANIIKDGDWVKMTFSNVYAVSNIDLAYSGGDWDYLNNSTQITDNACYSWAGTAISCDELTAISADVQYNAADMANITFTGSDQHFTGLSTNHLFEVYGTLGTSDAFGKTETIGNITDDISEKSFTSALYITAANNTSSTSDPTQGAIEFITPSTPGILYLYLNGTASTLTLKKKDTSTSTSLSGAKYKAMTVDANTHYFINGAGSGNRGLYAIKYVSTYAVSITPTNVTKATGDETAIKGKAYTATFTAPVGYTLPSDVTSLTIGGVAQTKGTGYTWTISDGTATLTVPADKVTGNIVVTVTGTAATTYDVDFSLTNVAYSSGDNEGTNAATSGVAFSTVFAASSGYSLPGTITVTIGGETATVSTDYTWNQGTGALTILAASVTDDISVTIVGEELEGDGCEDLVNVEAATATTLTVNVGSATVNNPSSQSKNSKAIKLNSSGYIELSPKAGKSFAVGDSLIVVVYNQATSGKTTGFKIGSDTYTASIAKESNHTFRQKLTGDNIVSSKVKIERESSDGWFVSAIIKHCEDLPSCTTPTLPSLSDQTVCPGSDIAAWDATATNAATITAASEDITYSWKKKGSDTELATTASFDLGSSATESQAGTYVVTVIVSATGKISKSASAEVDLAVTPATETPSVSQSPATVYVSNSVTLTATCGSAGTKTWSWHTCNSDGTGESSAISGATTNTYALTAPASAGTYYYKVKVTGDGTNACGTASAVYTLTVSPAASSEDCFHYVSVLPDKDISPSSGASIVTPTHATTLEGGTMKVGSQQITITKNGLKLEGSKSVSITLESALEAGNVVIVKGTSATAGYGVTINGVNFYESGSKTFDVSYTVAAGDGLVGKTALTVTKYSGSSYLQEIKITGCGTSCTDPEVTASVNNSTACVGTSVTFTATGAHASATYQWQKLDGTWTNISGATASTYNINPVVAGDAGKYRVIAKHDCNRTSNEVTLSVPTLPDFGSTVPASVSVMQTIALSINTVEATDAVKYKWYKSADPTWDAGDTEIGTNKELIKAYDGEATGSPSYYIFCRAQNSCGITTSSAIAVNVTAYVEEDCATRGNEGDAEFGFEYSAGQATYSSTACWSMNDNSKKLIYAAPEGKYFKTMKVTIASSSASKASYNWSTNGGTTFTEVAINSINTTLTEKTIDVSAHGNVNALQIGRNLDGKGESSGTLYVSKICFEYTDACTATTVTPSTASVNYEMGGAWSNPTFTLGPAAVSGETLTYSSSNEDIASVDDDGTVTFNGDAGTVTITASYAGGEVGLTDYCASEGSYTITVSCSGGAPKIVADGSTEMEDCNSSVTLYAKKQDGTAFADGTYQWFRNGTEIDDATSSSYTATQAGTYTVERTNTSDCTTPSTNSAIVTSETTEPEVERLVPFQYYHVNKTYSDQMKMRHLFAVKNSGTLDGKHFKMYVSRNGGVATDVTSSNALVVVPNGDGHVDTVMVDLNKLSGKYSENDELVFTCKAIDCERNVSEVYKNTITMNVIGATPTLALICSGSSKAGGTRKTGELTVGGDFLTGYNVADLCQQTGNTSFDANTEWGLYTDLKTQYIVTPVNGYAVFNKLNYEPFDILLLTDYPKASKSDAAAAVLDDMADLCDYRPMLSFKTHMVAKSPSKWAEKGFTTSPVVTKADGRLNLNIVCYAHPMFEGLKSGEDVYEDAENTSAPLVYTMLTGGGYESSKGMQGFELAAAENFVTIGLTHYNGTITKDSPLDGEAEWTPGSEDRMLVTVAERQTNIEARFILFSLNCGAQSKLTDRGEQVILACLEYLLDDDPLHVADCSFTFDNGASNEHDAAWYTANCNTCTGTKGDGKWTTAANWGPDYRLLPGEFTSVRIKAPVEVNDEHAHVMEVRIIDEGSINIPAGKALDVKSTIRRMEGSEIYPTEEGDIHIGSNASGNGTLIFNNDDGDTKARVDMYSTAKADMVNMSAATSTWQYIGTPHNDVASATRNYYDSWLYQYSGSGWEVIPNGGPLVPFRGYCVTHPDAPVVFDMEGTLVATTAQDIAIPAGYTVIANSWTAPIDINAITDDDMEGISDKSIYFFNTGSDVEGDNTTGTEAGTYRATPIHSASYTGDWQIPSMQGFYISTTSAGTLHLDYERHVRPTGSRSVVSNPMYAPRRAAAESDEPNVLKIFARGSRYQDKLVVLEREDFTRGYDSGWDGEAWGGGTLSPMVYVTGEGREDAVSAIPEFEGTVVAFKAGEDSEYRFEFIYDGDESLYLFDTENNTYTQIMTGNAYYFTTTDKAAHSRFILTRKAPQVATGVGEVPSDQVLSTKAKKLIIEDKMYILLNGMLYDATGKVVFK